MQIDKRFHKASLIEIKIKIKKKQKGKAKWQYITRLIALGVIVDRQIDIGQSGYIWIYTAIGMKV